MDKKRIRVLYVVPRCASTGPLFVLRDIIRFCDRDAFSLQLIALGEEIPERCCWDEFAAMLPCEHVLTSLKESLLGRMAPLAAAIDSFSPHVIHSMGALPDIAVSRIHPEKQLVTIHCDFRANYTETYGKLPGIALSRLHMRAVRKAKQAVAVSDSLSQTYDGEYRFHPSCIRNGVVIDPRGEEDKGLLRQRLGLPKERTIFVCAATFSQGKNQSFLADIFEKQGANAPLLLLLGDGSMWPKLQATYQNAQNVRMPGRVNNVRDYLHAADYYVSASRSEGMPLSVLEALAAGLPVLLSDIPPHREIAALAQPGGELFQRDDGASFAKAMERLMGRDRRLASRCAREAGEKHFNAVAMSQAYQQLYRSLRQDHREEAPACQP